jgi:hypothetical protein
MASEKSDVEACAQRADAACGQGGGNTSKPPGARGVKGGGGGGEGGRREAGGSGLWLPGEAFKVITSAFVGCGYVVTWRVMAF